MKKILLGLGLLPLAMLPLSITSCTIFNSALRKEVAKFKEPVETKRPDYSAEEASDLFYGDSATKLNVLYNLAKIPDLSSEFTIVVNWAYVNEKNYTTLDVDITIIDTLTRDEKEVVLKIVGFITKLNELNPRQLEKKQINKTVNVRQAKTLIDSTNSQIEKLAILAGLVKLPWGFIDEFNVNIKSVDYIIYNNSDNNTLEGELLVEMLISEIETPLITRLITFNILWNQLQSGNE